MLNQLWSGLFIIAFISALGQWMWAGDATIFAQITAALFEACKLAVTIALGLTGLLCFWLGIARLAERSGATAAIARMMAPLFRHLMPGVPAGHPAHAAVSMNIAANMLGLDNAATPLGIKAMQALQGLNPHPDRATDAQILFLVLNTSSVTLFPVTVFLYRAQMGAAQPTDVFIPILLATSVSTLAGLTVVAIKQRLALFNASVLGAVALLVGLIGSLIVYLLWLGPAGMAEGSSLLANLSLLSLIVLLLAVCLRRGVPVYDEFIEGAKEGFATAVQIIPYLVAMLAAIAALRGAGVIDAILHGLHWCIVQLGWDARFVDALPVAFTKPFSGSGARAMMIDVMQSHGADSFAGRLAAVMQGSTETTLYVLAVYFGAVGIKHTRYAISCGLLADVAGMLAAIGVCYWFFS